MIFLAVDPGSAKCGVAVMDDENCLHREIITVENSSFCFAELVKKYGIKLIVIGNGTCCMQVSQRIRATGVELVSTDEKNSTLEARQLYFRYNPPCWLFRLIPAGLLIPPVPYDDYVAEVIGLRYFKNTKR